MKQNNNSEKIKNENPIFEQILKIIDSPEKQSDLEKLEKAVGFKKTVMKIIETNSRNIDLAIFLISEVSPDYFLKFPHLHSDEKTVKVAISRKPTLFYSISSKLRNSPEIGVKVIEAMVREGKNYLEIESFIEKNFPKYKKKLYKKYKSYLELADDIFSDDLNKSLFLIKKSNPGLYELISNIGLIDNTGKKLKINRKIVSNIVNELSLDPEYLKLEKDEKDNYKKLYIENLFGIKIKYLQKEEKYIFNLLLDLISISESKNKLTETLKEQELEKDDNTDEQKKGTTEKNTDINKEKTNNLKEIIDFSYPESYAYKVSGGYNLETVSGKKIFITDTEKQEFTSKALSNFIKFYNIIYNLGISFLWDKYSHDFKILCNNKIGFNYKYGEGITEFKTLSVLNMIGKNIGIPEDSFEIEEINENGEKNKYKKIGCFKTLGDAKRSFSKIKETGVINGKKYSDNSSFGNGAVENKLIEVLCIDQKGNGLNISRWK